MLAANETIAERFFWLELPFVYRTHEVPDEEKVEQLENFIGKMGYILKGNATHPKSFQKCWNRLRENLRNCLFIE